MKLNPLFAVNGSQYELQKSDTGMAHLFEIELGQYILTGDHAKDATQVTVDSTFGCYIGMHLSAVHNVGDVLTMASYEITAIDEYFNILTFSTGLVEALSNGAFFVDSVYVSENIVINKNTNTEVLPYQTVVFGALTGRIMLTDYDMPIVINRGSRAILSNDDAVDAGSVVYSPYPIKYNAVNVDTLGKVNSVDITLANIDQLVGQIVLTRDSLRKKKCAIKTVYIDDPSVEEYGIMIPHTNQGRSVSISMSSFALNEPFYHYKYVDTTSLIIDEFEGFIDNAGIDEKAVNLTCFSNIDLSGQTKIPKRTYTRIRCPFVYRGRQCRFTDDDLTLVTPLLSTAGIGDFILVNSSLLRFYFNTFKPNETHVIRIDNEYILIDGYSAHPNGKNFTSDQTAKLSLTEISTYITAQPQSGYMRFVIKERGYAGSDGNVTHNAGTKAFIVTCRKTEHDCEMHSNSTYFGAFPAIPKPRNNII